MLEGRFKIFVVLFGLIVSCQSKKENVPAENNTEIYSQNKEKYIFFLHNRFLEEHGLEEQHPEYGIAEYEEIKDIFKQEGFTVISEKRARNTETRPYGKKVLNQIDSLILKGVEPNAITVVGTSKGGFIAFRVSTFAKNPDLNFVVIGSSFGNYEDELHDVNLCGNILAINEKSDEGSQSLQWLIDQSNCKPKFKEIELNTGLKHGFLFKALDDWLLPTIAWANQED